MAQRREKRRRRATRRRTSPVGLSPAARRRSTRLRRVVIAFLILIGLAGILAVSATGDETGAPRAPLTGAETAR